ncbi:TetR family transcriptional regulator C-terminal domain-containing protein [Nocardia flavorosea]|uniref:TetR family transcriptional regulator n=1 Tax=Nocardia flavorosea TaxID=53429 RepID=A0A846YGH5_9NOCA|nr:TetR family transcriptional regulator C-terminal domain-containing protein [Nocardia flavorosea]NKY56830.1 hypothetical protein [Nocardia flavorosea]
MNSEKDAVLETVLESIAIRGVHETTPRRVADRAGVDGKTLRRLYGDRYGMLVTATRTLELRRDRLLAAVEEVHRPTTVTGRRDYLEAVARALLLGLDHRDLLVRTELVANARSVGGLEVETRGLGEHDRAVVAEALKRVGAADIELETERLITLLSGLAFELVYPHGAPGGTADRVLRHHIASIVH